MKTRQAAWNVKIDQFIKKIGGKKSEDVGCYIINGRFIDLTSSGSEEWMITKNILDKL